MKSGWQRGASNFTGVIILMVLIVIMLVSSKQDPNPSGWSLTPRVSSTAGGTTISSSGSGNTSSSYSLAISIGSGNAPYSYQPYEEYITIENRGRNPVDITGWQLKNGKDKRPYYVGATLQRFSADIAAIPQATLYLPASGTSFPQNVVLGESERAIITTGSVGVQTPYRITSFKENICTGYIESLPDYAFSPPLSQNCPRPALEPGIESLEPTCRDFIKNLSSCRTPEFNVRDNNGQPCNSCVNGTLLPSSCAAFIKEHFSYQGCLAYHGSDPNFSGRTWRIFLLKGWEMWAKDYETIELYDRLGQLVDFNNY